MRTTLPHIYPRASQPFVLDPPSFMPQLRPRLPRKIHVHYVRPANHPQGVCKLKAESVSPRQLKAGTPFTIKGVVGCSPSHSPEFALRVQIDIDGWETHIVNGRDLL